MDRHHRTHALGLRHIEALAYAIILATGTAGCEWGGETRGPAQPPGQGAQPDPELGERPGDIDIGARSTETGTAERNEAAARADAPPGERADTTSESTRSGGASAGTEVAAAGSTGAVSASAVLEPVGDNQARGEASFIETEEGLEVVVTMSGLEPGEHGIHVHENGDCSGAAAEAAGDHFNPDGAPHGAPSDDPSQRHAGDLGNISADASGEAELTLTVDGLTAERERGVASRAIIVHSGEDDLMSQPSGESGDPVACGVIEVSGRG